VVFRGGGGEEGGGAGESADARAGKLAAGGAGVIEASVWASTEGWETGSGTRGSSSCSALRIRVAKAAAIASAEA